MISKTEGLPDKWNISIDKAKDKARKLLKQIVAIDQNTSIVVGRLNDVGLDRLWKLKYSYCKLILANAEKYRLDGKFESKIDDEQLCFINKPEMIMSLEELQRRFPEIHADVHVKMKTDTYG